MLIELPISKSALGTVKLVYSPDLNTWHYFLGDKQLEKVPLNKVKKILESRFRL